jgi:hypothetical protein
MHPPAASNLGAWRKDRSAEQNQVLRAQPPISYIPLKFNETNDLRKFGGVSLCLEQR